jgi:hypothetical protein
MRLPRPRGEGRRVLLTIALLLGATTAAVAQDAPGTPPQAPVLRIEAGGHIGAIARLAVDATGALMASASYDKTVRLWSVADGRQIAVLRPPIGPREEGELYAVALTRDAGRVFAAGATGRTWDGSFDIYVFNGKTGALAGLLGKLPAPIEDLKVSPTGRRLAAGLAQGGIRLWDDPAGKLTEIRVDDASYAGPVRSVAFDGQDRLFTVAADGHARAYDPAGKKFADAAVCAGSKPWGLAASPDGGLLAITCETADKQGRLRVEIVSARTLAPVLAPDTTGLSGEGLLAVAWTADGHGGVQLLAGGYAHAAGGYVIRRWGDFGLGASTDIPAARDTIRDIVALPGAGAVYAAEDPGWGRMDGDGHISIRPTAPIADLRPSREKRLAVSADGGAIEFATGTGITRFDVRGHALSAIETPDPSLLAARTDAPGLKIENWRDTSEPSLNRQKLALDRGEYSRAAAIAPGDGMVLLGTDTHLRLFARDGHPLGSVETPATVRAVAFAGNGRVAVATMLDGSVRWYGIAPDAAPAERAALFAHADGVRWVLFTPEGFFDDADRGGNDLVGVHLNRGRNQSPDWLSFEQAYRVLYAPEVVRARVLGEPAATQARLAVLGDLRARLASQPVVDVRAACARIGDGTCAELSLGRGGDARVPAAATSARLTVQVTDRGLGVGPLDAFVNGRNAGRIAAPKPGAPFAVDVPLDPGTDAIQLRVYDGGGTVFTQSAPLTIARDAAATAPGGGGDGGRLFVLAIGIDHFANPSLSLHYAVADEQSFVGLVRKAAEPVFDSVNITSLTDAQATRAGILAAFDTLARDVKPTDTFLFYVASHGVVDEDTNRFLLIPQDLSDISTYHAIAGQAVDEDTLVGALSRVQARDALLLIDTCHSGHVAADNLANVGHETGRYLIAASSSVQEALDSYDGRNGVFVVALREALSGRAGEDGDGNIGVLSLGEYLSRRVGQLAKQRDHDQDAVFRAAQHDLRSFPVAHVIQPDAPK